jgi:hypothetical protein
LNDEGQQQMAEAWSAWSKVTKAHQEAPEGLEVEATQQEALEEAEVKEVDD